jgi:hypothetical protein
VYIVSLREDSVRVQRIVLVVSILAVGSFVWWYPTPLNADIHLHLASAKAFLHLLSGPETENYPYQLHIIPASYALSIILLSLLIKVAGLSVGAKLALTVYALLFSHAVWYMVGQINPRSTWTRLIGIPLALNYLFHWGYWPAMLGTVTAVYAIGLTLRYEGKPRFVPVGLAMRLLTFLMHPGPALALGLFDVVSVLSRALENRRWLNPFTWDWKSMLLLWWPTVLGALITYISLPGSVTRKASTDWGSPKLQAFELVRSVYITDNLLESASMLIISLLLMVAVARHLHRTPGFSRVFVAGVLLCLTGVLIPMDGFWCGSTRIGCRVSFLGLIVLFGLVSLVEERVRKVVAAWVLVAILTNVGVSHYVWQRHTGSHEQAMTVLKDHFGGVRINGQRVPNPSYLGVPIGASVGICAWNRGYVGDAFNAATDFGPVRYVGLDSTARNEGSGLILYHPYWTGDSIQHSAYGEAYNLPGYSQVFMLEDSIYTLYLR